MLRGGGEKWHQPPLCCMEWEFMPATIWEALMEGQTISQASFRSLPSLCVCLCHLPAWQYSAAVFYPRQGGWVSIFYTSGTCCGEDPCWFSGKGSPCTGTDMGLFQKGSHINAQDLGVRVEHSQKLVSRLSTLSRCLSTYAEMTPTLSFILWKAMPPLLDMLQEEGTIFPSASQGIFKPSYALPYYLPSFSTGVLYHLQGSTLAMTQTFKTPIFELCWL